MCACFFSCPGFVHQECYEVFHFRYRVFFLGMVPFVYGTLPVQKSSLFLLYDHAQAFGVEIMLRSPNIKRNNNNNNNNNNKHFNGVYTDMF